uniref:DNA-directed DNA polymerase n=1 Tax=Rhizophagus irregularis (strain DAOM 181602 / DAOM 197198 / MUCL 43194) TaxID=747089 RepID=U9T7P9_RHIID
MEMHDFAEKARRGGITMACRRYFRANNPKCKNFYMRSPKTWLSYVDANNLYGWAMSQYLPIGDPGNNKKVLDTILKKRNDASRGYYVQLECHFPSQTHNYLQDLPPTVENIKSEAGDILRKDGEKNYVSVEKLITHLGPRDEYVLHYSEL